MVRALIARSVLTDLTVIPSYNIYMIALIARSVLTDLTVIPSYNI